MTDGGNCNIPIVFFFLKSVGINILECILIYAADWISRMMAVSGQKVSAGKGLRNIPLFIFQEILPSCVTLLGRVQKYWVKMPAIWTMC